ncbi:MAG TPA: hypothetical protein VEI07_26525 [Planctomycetaceae bacterium]|nr:hypothetical protein [Planctomycetaceae bacterium]
MDKTQRGPSEQRERWPTIRGASDKLGERLQRRKRSTGGLTPAARLSVVGAQFWSIHHHTMPRECSRSFCRAKDFSGAAKIRRRVGLQDFEKFAENFGR